MEAVVSTQTNCDSRKMEAAVSPELRGVGYQLILPFAKNAGYCQYSAMEAGFDDSCFGHPLYFHMVLTWTGGP